MSFEHSTNPPFTVDLLPVNPKAPGETNDPQKTPNLDYLNFHIQYPTQGDGQHQGNTRAKAKRWTAEEDEKLRQAILLHGTTNWQAVASFVGNDRTRAQCSQRWNRVLNPEISKANWSKEEEELLLKSVNQFGNKAWTRVAQQFGNRSDVQCRFKYNYLMKKLEQNSINYEDDNQDEHSTKDI